MSLLYVCFLVTGEKDYFLFINLIWQAYLILNLSIYVYNYWKFNIANSKIYNWLHLSNNIWEEWKGYKNIKKNTRWDVRCKKKIMIYWEWK